MLHRIFILLLSVSCSFAMAEPVQLNYQGLKLNAEYNEVDKDKPVFVILHGTWMHHTTELPTYLQELASDEDYSSLNISLGLGLDDRQQLIECDSNPTILARHDSAVEELKLWFDWLGEQGYKRFVLIAHSRGGAQASLFAQTYHYPGLEQLVLIAPATYQQQKVAAGYEDRYSKPLAAQISYFQSLENQKDPVTEAPVLYCTFAKVSAESFLSYYLPEPQKHTPAMLANMDIPTKVFLGSEDDISHRLMEYEVEFADNDKVKIFWIEGSDHFFRDLYSDEIMEEVMSDL